MMHQKKKGYIDTMDQRVQHIQLKPTEFEWSLSIDFAMLRILAARPHPSDANNFEINAFEINGCF